MGTNSAARFIRPVFAHEGSTLSADSADYNQAGNAFDAYGNVVITQPDGTVIHSDFLNYDGNTRVAILTSNVKMIDRDATLTTNHLTYNMATKIGTYIGGGKIENAQNVLTSQNGYYFANSQDAYFRYDVVVNTPDALIKTDTLKYNTGTKIAWFFGPTTINGKGKNKQSKLYTENGRYNTLTDQAWFGKRNLYTEDTKSLKGDSLYYDGKAGFGKAINNITFLDTVQKVILKGNQGIYRKGDESALVTRNAYVVIEAEQDSGKVDSIWMTADTLITKLIPMKQFIPATKEELKSDKDINTDPVVEGEGIIVGPQAVPSVKTAPKEAAPERSGRGKRKQKKGNSPDQNVAPKSNHPPADSVQTGSAVAVPSDVAVHDSLSISAKPTTNPAKITVNQKGKMPADSARRLSDTTKVGLSAGNARVDSLKQNQSKLKAVLTDSVLVKGTVKKAAAVGIDSMSRKTKAALKDTSNAGRAKDSVNAKSINPQDTAKTRVIYAYHKVKIFKSDLQSRSDSAFYSYADSIIRCYHNPIIWTQGTQLTGDTIYLQMKNKKLDNMLLQHNAFIVSTEGDSTKFNQVKGKVVTGFFVDSKLKNMFVDGNAESIYYSVEDSAVTGVNRSLSSRMRLEFVDSKLQKVMLVRKPEGKFYPIEKVPKDIEVLPGFIWKPKERPKSKEEIIPGGKRSASAKARKPAAASGKKAVVPAGGKKAVAPATVKGAAVPAAGKPAASKSTNTGTSVTEKGSTATKAVKNTPVGIDTTRNVIPVKKDSNRRTGANIPKADTVSH